MNDETKAARFIEERAARAALAAFNGDDEAMADALMAAPEATLSAIARAVIPIITAAERERCAQVAEAQRYSPAQVKASYADGDTGPEWFNEGINEAAAAIRALPSMEADGER
jgi:hypothetical protein